LGGRQTFIGQWPDIDVVIMKPEDGKTKNENILPPPFHVEEVYGKILLVRMDENSEPQDFTLDEYNSFCIRDESLYYLRFFSISRRALGSVILSI
jgi:hypothetical protein